MRDTFERIYRFLIWEHGWDEDVEQELSSPASSSEFKEFFSKVRVKRLIEEYLGISRTTFLITVPLFGYILGLLVSWRAGVAEQFVRNKFVLVYFLILTLSLGGVLLLEKDIPEAFVRMEDSFEMPTEEYYGFVADFLERLTEPLPHVACMKGKYLHRPSLIASLFGGVFLVVFPAALFPKQVSNVIGFEIAGVPMSMQIYILSLLFVAVIVGVLVVWFILVSTLYLGVRVSRHKVKLDITRSMENLGFTPYANLVLKALSVYLVGYLVMTFFLLDRVTTWSTVMLTILSIIPVVGFVASQYGIHRAIVSSKEERLRQLRSEFDDELKIWFSFENPDPTQTSSYSSDTSNISDVIEAKRAIDEIPDWPMNMSSVFKLISATFASNVWVLTQAVGVIY